MIRDALITTAFLMVVYFAVRGAVASCGDAVAVCRTFVRARRP